MMSSSDNIKSEVKIKDQINKVKPSEISQNSSKLRNHHDFSPPYSSLLLITQKKLFSWSSTTPREITVRKQLSLHPDQFWEEELKAETFSPTLQDFDFLCLSSGKPHGLMGCERNLWNKFSETYQHVDATKTCSEELGNLLFGSTRTLSKTQQFSYKWLNFSYPDSSRSSHRNKHTH